MKRLFKIIKIKSCPADQVSVLINSAPWIKETFVEMINKGTCYVYSKVIFNKSLGMVFLFTDLDDKDLADGENVCYIGNLYVYPKLRNMGIGTEVLEYVFDAAREKGFKHMTIGVEEKIEKNVRLYRKHGFTRELKRSSVSAVLKDRNGNPIPTKEHVVLLKDL